jgi:BlaI family penicillinase repressor
MPAQIRISDAEWEVMKVLWTRSPMTANDVADALQDSQHWNHRTTKTLLNRLVKKRAVRFVTEGRHYLYQPAVTQASCVKQETQSFISRVFDGAFSPLLVHFVKDAKLSPEEIRELKRLLEEKEK